VMIGIILWQTSLLTREKQLRVSDSNFKILKSLGYFQ